MNSMTKQIIKYPYNFARICNSVIKIKQLKQPENKCHYTSVAFDNLDVFASELLQRHHNRLKSNSIYTELGVRYFMKADCSTVLDVTVMTVNDLDTLIQDLITKNNDNKLYDVIKECSDKRIPMKDSSLKRLFRHYSSIGKSDVVVMLQKYAFKVIPAAYKRNGEFLHYLAKAQCLKGNSEKGLLILKECYIRHEGMRSYYRLIFRELIYDSVLNRSEASLVVFKKYVLEFDDLFSESYPLVCLWHNCWTSTWFSDQTLSNDLLDCSDTLRKIVKEKATAFSQSILKECNEDAVYRLLQALLKYDMMLEYTNVLHILFNFKLRNRDLRGCREIILNCEILGVSLPSDQTGKYIKMLIDESEDPDQAKIMKMKSKTFKLKF